MSAYRSAFSLICATWFLQLSGGILGIVTPLGLQSMGLGSVSIGLIAALHAAGYMAGAIYAPRFIVRVGHIRTFSAAAAICSIGALGLYMAPSALGWAIIRLVQGCAFVFMFTAAESWLGAAVEASKRGSVIGVYHVAAKAALFIGPLLIIGYSALQPENYILAGMFLTAALIPVCVTRQKEPANPVLQTLPLRSIIKVAPSAAVGVFLAGVINTGTLALLPIYAEAVAPDGFDTLAAVGSFAAANIGGLLSQWPFGRLSDRIDRRTVIALMALLAAMSAMVLGIYGDGANLYFLLGWVGLWGAGSLSFYGISVAHGLDRVQADQMTELMSGLLFIWAAGAVIGPLLSGFAMRTALGASGLFWLASFLLVVLAGVMMVRRVVKAEPASASHEDWNMVAPISIASSELDPRTSDS